MILLPGCGRIIEFKYYGVVFVLIFRIVAGPAYLLCTEKLCLLHYPRFFTL